MTAPWSRLDAESKYRETRQQATLKGGVSLPAALCWLWDRAHLHGHHSIALSPILSG
jgi:hypothetical protein